MSTSSIDHLSDALALPDPAFDAFWEIYLRARPDFVEGSAIELSREQLRQLLKVAFLAGREATLREVSLLKQN